VSAPSKSIRLSTGKPSIDHILLRGLPRSHVHPVEGDLGTGRTTLAKQFILGGKQKDECCLYVTLSEWNSLA
jgi:circadian clock protein KaiC